MSNDYKWLSGDGVEPESLLWEEASNQKVGEQPTLKGQQRRVGLIVIFLLFVGAIFYLAIDWQIERTEELTKADVLAVHTLVRQAAIENDIELVKTLMDDTDEDWVHSRLGSMLDNIYLNRLAFGLVLDSEAALNQELMAEVKLSPDLRTAEVVDQFPYGIMGDDYDLGVIFLEQTFHYHLQGNKWLLTSSPQSNWGYGKTMNHGTYVTLRYSERDEQQADYFYDLFDDLIGRMCEDDAVECPPRFQLYISFDRSDYSLTAFSRIISSEVFSTKLNNSLAFIIVPSPTVVGIPIDENGYQALFQGYANWMSFPLLDQYSTYSPFDDNPYIKLGPGWIDNPSEGE